MGHTNFEREIRHLWEIKVAHTKIRISSAVVSDDSTADQACLILPNFTVARSNSVGSYFEAHVHSFGNQSTPLLEKQELNPERTMQAPRA